MWASDYQYQTTGPAVAFIESAPMSEVQREQIAYMNAERILSIKSNAPLRQTGRERRIHRFSGMTLVVVTTRSEKAGTRDMNELSLTIRTPKGVAVIVGCSHPGVENILVAAAQIDKQLYTTIGGFHLVLAPGEEVERVANMLHETLGLQRVAPGHCTSEPGFAALMRKFGDRFDHAGIGAVLQLPH